MSAFDENTLSIFEREIMRRIYGKREKLKIEQTTKFMIYSWERHCEFCIIPMSCIVRTCVRMGEKLIPKMYTLKLLL